MADVDGTPRICEIVEYHLIDIDLKGLREFQTDTPQSDLAKSNVRTPAMRSGSPRTSRWPSALMASLYRARQFFHRPARELEIFGATFVGHAVADKMNDVANLNISFFFERLHGEPRPKTLNSPNYLLVSHVRFWPLADTGECAAHVRFRRQSRHGFLRCACPLVSGHQPSLNNLFHSRPASFLVHV